jgi:alpha-amylase/alpha-mannosidase (GH57 family)
MSPGPASLELLFLWHHHQPDYRTAADGRAELPWVRLHASKDYLDMAEHLERWPTLKATFNFVPSLLDQLAQAEGGGPDALFDLLARPVEALSAAERAEVAHRCSACPGHAQQRWPRLKQLVQRAATTSAPGASRPTLSDRELLDLEVYFLLAWCDPLYFGEPEVAEAIARGQDFTPRQRAGVLAAHARLLARVVPAYRRLAERGQVELSASPYYHPILPLLVDIRAGRRARPQLTLPREPFSAPEDARRQIERALVRHAQAFGVPPRGMWPSEGSVSPEVAELAAECGLKWLATDEGVLFASLAAEQRTRAAAHQPWRVATSQGEITIFFRDHELSDLVGFTYQGWRPETAADDLLARLRSIAAAHRGPRPPVVSIILDGENCWEGYADDGKPFLEALYSRLAAAPEIRTRTFSEVAADWADAPCLDRLHSGSWIDADFHIWVGHPEKNRAWDLISRARRALVQAGTTPESHPEAWESLAAAEGSDWFWWLGVDHYTADKHIFDRLFRGHLAQALGRAGLPVPSEMRVPIVKPTVRSVTRTSPIGFLRPSIDGAVTHYYEWELGGHYHLMDSGGAMHRTAGMVKDLYYGFDAERFYLRLDFLDGEKEREHLDLALDFLAPSPLRVLVHGLGPGARTVTLVAGGGEEQPMPWAECHVGAVLELGVAFESLGLKPGDAVELLALTLQQGRTVESFPSHELVRFAVPPPDFEDIMWSA